MPPAVAADAFHQCLPLLLFAGLAGSSL